MPKRSTKGWIALVTITVIALLLWLVPYIVNPATESFGINLGKGLGVVGFVLFALNILLASRHPLVDKLFFGLDKAYQVHEILGELTLICLLYHPTLISLRYLSAGLPFMAQFLLPGNDLARTLGTLSLVLMEALMITTIYLRLRYHQWKQLHTFFNLAFIAAVTHIVFISGDIRTNHALAAYLYLISVVTLAAIAKRTFTSFWLSPRYQYHVSRVTKLNNDTVQLDLQPAGKIMSYKGGQFAWLSFASKSVTTEGHPFSIISAPGDSVLSFAVKNLGDFTAKMLHIKPGETVTVEGPSGHFSYESITPKKQLWVAGGIGITPFVSLAASLPPEYEVQLFYTVSNQSDAVLLDRLTTLAETNPHLKVTIWDSSQNGRITAAALKSARPDLLECGILMCGPGPMQRALHEQLTALGVPNDHIYYEHFSLK